MSFNFMKELGALNRERFIEDDAERILKEVYDYFYNHKIAFWDLKWLRFIFEYNGYNRLLFEYQYGNGDIIRLVPLESIKIPSEESYARSVIDKIEEKLKSEGFDCTESKESYLNERDIMNNYKKELKSLKITF